MNKVHLFECLVRFYQKYHIATLAIVLNLVKPKVITRLDGGLASQMWQFALGYTVSRRLNFPLYIDACWFHKDGKDCKGNLNRRFLLLDTFPTIRKKFGAAVISSPSKNLKDRIFKLFHTDRFSKRPYYEFCEKDFFDKRAHYIEMYHAGFKYVSHYKNELVQLFTFQLSLSEEEKNILHKICNSESCALHIRRGDFLGTPFEVCTDYYYIEAIKLMRRLHNDIKIYVFTNDEEYAKKIIKEVGCEDFASIFEGRNEEDPRVDMYLISMCKHAIISNSAFSAFPTWLTYSPGKTVIRPKYWRPGKLKIPMQNTYMEPGWIQVPLSPQDDA